MQIFPNDIPCTNMILTEELDMVGVELRATWTQTRKVNGDAIQKRVSNKTNQWKGGKFIPLSMRSWSINTYCLSKVWFKSHSVDLRVLDITSINRAVKSWLYADMFFKPEELILYIPSTHGRRLVQNVKYKALACLIRSFLEIASNQNFRHSLYHEILYRYHVLEDHSLVNTGLPTTLLLCLFLWNHQKCTQECSWESSIYDWRPMDWIEQHREWLGGSQEKK